MGNISIWEYRDLCVSVRICGQFPLEMNIQILDFREIKL